MTYEITIVAAGTVDGVGDGVDPGIVCRISLWCKTFSYASSPHRVAPYWSCGAYCVRYKQECGETNGDCYYDSSNPDDEVLLKFRKSISQKHYRSYCANDAKTY